jgi:proteasome lid subunit RPN8/RPN11
MTSGPSGPAANLLLVAGLADAAIRRHAATAYPAECCGALLGSPDTGIEDAIPFENVAPGDQDRRFLLSAADYRRAEAIADETGRQLLGFYHSHPDHPAEPSAFDLAHAWPNLSYVIVSVRAGRPGDMRSWRLAPDRSRFAEEPLQSQREDT